MVYFEEVEMECGGKRLMAMGSERSKPLHNFKMPCLKWGNQKFLRCMKVDSDEKIAVVDRRSPVSEVESSGVTRRRLCQDLAEKRVVKVSKLRIESDDGDEGIDAVREKLMFDLKTAADKMKDAIFREDATEKERVVAAAAAATVVEEEVRPWNLRTRRAACKAPIGGAGGGGGGGGKGLRIEERRRNNSPMRSEGGKSPRLRGGPEKRTKLSVMLSRKEIEEDFKMMTGERPSRRPKKRAKIVQNQMDSLFPGLWLPEITVDTYKVPEIPESGKR